MLRPRWQKLLRDLWLMRGRTVLMVVAIAVSLFGLGTVVSAYAILTPEISRNYLATNPAAATLELDRVDDTLLAAVKARPGIADAEARDTRGAGAGRPRPVATSAAVRRPGLRRDAHQYLPA